MLSLVSFNFAAVSRSKWDITSNTTQSSFDTVAIRVNHLTPNGHYIGRTAQLTSNAAFYIFIQQIYALSILNMLHNLRFFLFKMTFIS